MEPGAGASAGWGRVGARGESESGCEFETGVGGFRRRELSGEMYAAGGGRGASWEGGVWSVDFRGGGLWGGGVRGGDSWGTDKYWAGLAERRSLAGSRRGGRSPARPNLQRGIKFEHRRCNRIEGHT